MISRFQTKWELLQSNWHATAWQFARFILVGMLNTAAGYLIYAAGILAGLRPEAALLAAFVFATMFNYSTYARMVFRRGGVAVFIRFVVAYLVIYVVNVGALRLTMALGVDSLLAQALVLPFVVVCTFAIFKFGVFKSSRSHV